MYSVCTVQAGSAKSFAFAQDLHSGLTLLTFSATGKLLFTAGQKF